ncbi:predicted protein [Postia placenta Mad-698-R]|nr:predicted protein [Postia placenta Mad-698-R]
MAETQEGRTGRTGKHRDPGPYPRWSPSRGCRAALGSNDAITQHLMQCEYGRLCGVRDLRRVSWARRHDELFIFSGHTHTVATKANKPVWARSVSWRGHGPSVSASALPISPNSTGSPPGILSLGSGSGLGRNSKSPSTVAADAFPRLESHGCLRSAPDAVRPHSSSKQIHKDLLDMGTTGKVTGDPNARMRWTSQSYINHVWNKYWVALQGWNPHVPFKNPSNLPGGTRVFNNLIFRCERGIIRFVKIPEHERHNIDMTKVVPGGIVACKPWPGRPDIKRARHRPVSNPHNLPLRRQRPGPITPEYVWENADAEIGDDGTLEDDEIVETWDEEYQNSTHHGYHTSTGATAVRADVNQWVFLGERGTLMHCYGLCTPWWTSRRTMSSDHIMALPPPHELTWPVAPRSPSPGTASHVRDNPGVCTRDYAYVHDTAPAQAPTHRVFSNPGAPFSPQSRTSTNISQYNLVSAHNGNGNGNGRSSSGGRDTLAGLWQMIGAVRPQSRSERSRVREREWERAAREEDKHFRTRQSGSSGGIPDIMVESPTTTTVSRASTIATANQPHLLSPEMHQPSLLPPADAADFAVSDSDQRPLLPLPEFYLTTPSAVGIANEDEQQLPAGFVPMSAADTPHDFGAPKAKGPRYSYEVAPIPPGVVYPDPPGRRSATPGRRSTTPHAAAGVALPPSPSSTPSRRGRRGSLSGHLSPLSLPLAFVVSPSARVSSD